MFIVLARSKWDEKLNISFYKRSCFSSFCGDFSRAPGHVRADPFSSSENDANSDYCSACWRQFILTRTLINLSFSFSHLALQRLADASGKTDFLLLVSSCCS